jgi:hypothetical protein
MTVCKWWVLFLPSQKCYMGPFFEKNFFKRFFIFRLRVFTIMDLLCEEEVTMEFYDQIYYLNYIGNTLIPNFHTMIWLMCDSSTHINTKRRVLQIYDEEFRPEYKKFMFIFSSGIIDDSVRDDFINYHLTFDYIKYTVENHIPMFWLDIYQDKIFNESLSITCLAYDMKQRYGQTLRNLFLIKQKFPNDIYYHIKKFLNYYD